MRKNMTNSIMFSTLSIFAVISNAQRARSMLLAMGSFVAAFSPGSFEMDHGHFCFSSIASHSVLS